MLTEVKKTVHIVVDDMNAVPDETMIQNALNQNVQAMVTAGMMQVRVFDEYGHAMQAGAELVPPRSDTEKVCPPIDARNVSYHVWSVQMHFIRRCAFEPEAVPLKSIVAVVDEQCRKMAKAILENVPEPDKIASMSEDAVTEKLHELFQDGLFSLSD